MRPFFYPLLPDKDLLTETTEYKEIIEKIKKDKEIYELN